MAMTPLPPAPSRGDPANFADRGDALMAALPGFVTEANDLQLDVADKQQIANDAAATATTKATEASNSAIAASDSAANAAASASGAGAAATAAFDSRGAAATSEANAAESATAAANSAASVEPQNLATDYFGDVEPAITWPGMRWAHESAGVRVRRNVDNTAWVVEGNLFRRTVPGMTFAEIDALSIDEGSILATDQGLAFGWDGTKYAASGWRHDRLAKEYDLLVIQKTGASTANIRGGLHVFVGGRYITYATDTSIAMPALTAGEDYSVWVKPDGTAVAVADPFSAPAAAPAPGAVKIGGFHYGLVVPSTTPASGSFNTAPISGAGGSMAWTQADVDKLAGINEFSIWDLTFRCKSQQYGKTYDPWRNDWVGIYFASTDTDTNGMSRYNTDVASGTVLPLVPRAWGGDGILRYTALNVWNANEMVSSVGDRLIRYEEFVSAAFGVTENQSLGGAASTIPATARQPGYTSRIGLEQATGNHWTIGGPISSVNGTAYEALGRGSWYGSTGMALFGGDRNGAANSGSRAANFDNSLSISNWNLGVRAAGDHLNLGRVAR